MVQSSNQLALNKCSPAQENPDKGYTFSLDSDLAMCVLEVWVMVGN